MRALAAQLNGRLFVDPPGAEEKKILQRIKLDAQKRQEKSEEEPPKEEPPMEPEEALEEAPKVAPRGVKNIAKFLEGKSIGDLNAFKVTKGGSVVCNKSMKTRASVRNMRKSTRRNQERINNRRESENALDDIGAFFEII